jgi:glutamine synthetase
MVNMNMLQSIRANQLETVRFVFADQHGVLRGKTIVAAEVESALKLGVNFTATMLAKDTSGRTVFPVFNAGAGDGGKFGFPELQGAADLTMIADPTTFRILPWAHKTGWVLCDVVFSSGHPDPLKAGQPVPFSTRHVLRQALAKLNSAGYHYAAGLEVELHLFALIDPRLGLRDSGQPGFPGAAPEVHALDLTSSEGLQSEPHLRLLTKGYQYLTEQRYDAAEPILDRIRRDLLAIDLPVRTLEVEFGPSQFELTFGVQHNLEVADSMVLLRSAVKQIAARYGCHATFMCRPKLANVMSSGWHLHQSIVDQTGRNVFIPEADQTEPLSKLGMQFVAGLMTHAVEGMLFTTPTLNGYKRYRTHSLAPDRVLWARDNRGAMLRVLGGPGDAASRVENRVGEPAANPYLYLASQVLAGLDGIQRQLDPGPSADLPYSTEAIHLPTQIGPAIQALKGSHFFREQMGSGLIDYYCSIKEAELQRFEQEVSEWEQREYFDLF